MKALSPQPIDLSTSRFSPMSPQQLINSPISSSQNTSASSSITPTRKTTFNIDTAPTDPLFGLMARHKADTFPQKVDLGVGAYRDNNGKPWVLPSVRKVCLILLSFFSSSLLLSILFQKKHFFCSYFYIPAISFLKISQFNGAFFFFKVLSQNVLFLV